MSACGDPGSVSTLARTTPGSVRDPSTFVVLGRTRQKKTRAAARRPRRSRRIGRLGEKNPVDDLDHAVRLKDVVGRDLHGGVLDPLDFDVVPSVEDDLELPALEGLEERPSAVPAGETVKPPVRPASRHHVVEKDLAKRREFGGLEEVRERPFGELAERGVCGSEDGEGTPALERLDETRGFDGLDQDGVRRRIEGVLDDVPARIHRVSAYVGHGKARKSGRREGEKKERDGRWCVSPLGRMRHEKDSEES